MSNTDPTPDQAIPEPGPGWPPANPLPEPFNVRNIIYNTIDAECVYQDNLPPGRSDGRQKQVGDYLTLIRLYSARADAAYADNDGDVPALHVIRKIAAICVRAMEAHGAPRR